MSNKTEATFHGATEEQIERMHQQMRRGRVCHPLPLNDRNPDVLWCGSCHGDWTVRGCREAVRLADLAVGGEVGALRAEVERLRDRWAGDDENDNFTLGDCARELDAALSKPPHPFNCPTCLRHNHTTRNIRPAGECPACDVYHAAEVTPPAEQRAEGYPAGHGWTPSSGPFGTGVDTCRVMLARYVCPYAQEEHDPALPPVDVDVFGYRRGRLAEGGA
jgi:hypothetical protein